MDPLPSILQENFKIEPQMTHRVTSFHTEKK